MSEKFKNKYTIKSARLAEYDYSRNGMYFVTICAKDREHFFGEIENGKMELSEIGKIVQEEWMQTPTIRSNVILDEWIIMPNHFHGIIEICNELRDDALRDDALRCRDALQCVSTQCVSTTADETGYKNKFGPQINNLSSIIRGFKGIVTKRVHTCGFDFQWQPRFYDHIIRNEKSLWQIREYIRTNPKMWERDRNNMENVFM